MSTPNPTSTGLNDRSRFKTAFDWTLQDVKNIITAKQDEPDWFDFKADLRYLPKPKESNDDRRRKSDLHKRRIQELACAFANTSGGFIIFGVTNRKEDEGERVIGIDPDKSYNDELSTLIRQIDPPLTPFTEQPISAGLIDGNERKLWIVHIVKSASGPHMMSGTYYKRMPGQNVPMNAKEVSDRIIGAAILKGKAKALRHEMELWGTIATACEQSPINCPDRFDVEVFKQLVIEITAAVPAPLAKSLHLITQIAKRLNSSLDSTTAEFTERSWTGGFLVPLNKRVHFNMIRTRNRSDATKIRTEMAASINTLDSFLNIDQHDANGGFE